MLKQTKSKIKILALVGPTGVGKTDLSLDLALALNGEIISADSMQIYMGMDIGTAKANSLERQKVKHYCLDLVNIHETYSAADYQRDARKAAEEISDSGKMPIFVGGTGLYLRAALEHYDFETGGKDRSLRESLYHKAETLGNEALYAQLQDADPERAAALHPNDLRRVVRALEFYTLTGEKISAQEDKTKANESFFEAVIIGLRRPREDLYRRIDLRVDMMMEEGLLKEVKGLIEAGLNSNSTPGQALGYKEFFPYFSGESSLENCLQILKRNSRRYAKRQMTWFNARKEIFWFDLSSYEREERRQDLVQDILKVVNR